MMTTTKTDLVQRQRPGPEVDGEGNPLAFDAKNHTLAHTGRGRPDMIHGGDYGATVYTGTPAQLQWVDFENAGAAGSALKGLRKKLDVATSLQEWNEIASDWYAAQ